MGMQVNGYTGDQRKLNKMKDYIEVRESYHRDEEGHWLLFFDVYTGAVKVRSFRSLETAERFADEYL
jgi:hypothetical protein